MGLEYIQVQSGHDWNMKREIQADLYSSILVADQIEKKQRYVINFLCVNLQ